MTRMRVRRILTQQGVDVCMAEDGLAALREFHADPFGFDAAIIDLDLPVMSGSELTGHLRKVFPELPLLIIASALQRAELELEGDVLFAAKPLVEQQLISRLRVLRSIKRLCA